MLKPKNTKDDVSHTWKVIIPVDPGEKVPLIVTTVIGVSSCIFKMVAVTVTSLAASKMDTLMLRGSPGWMVFGARIM